jgi:alpha-beta hydrolase superfamily lysophospholipase
VRQAGGLIAHFCTMPVKKICLVGPLCFLLLLTCCAPASVIAVNPDPAEPRLLGESFISHDGVELPMRVWLPPAGIENARFILIAVHGFNDYANFIQRGAHYFSLRQIAVYAYDQRGFGNAPVRGRWSSTEIMAKDLKTLTRLVAAKHPDLPIFLLGHSMGGAVVLLAMDGENHPEVAGAILAAPAVWARATMPFYQTGALWVAAHTIPWFRVTGEILQRKASDNIEMLRELRLDPLVIKKTRIDVIYGLQNLMDKAYGAAADFRLNTLLLYGRRDEIIPRAPVMDVFRRLPDDRKELIIYENGYHMLLRDLQAEKVMDDIVTWVGKQSRSTAGDRK